jgi:AAA15 family ATPase/GTPase
MRLDFLEYCQDKNLPSEWRLEGCQLGNVNLIVGKNASGKSRILRSIKFLSYFLSGEEKLSLQSKFNQFLDLILKLRIWNKDNS